MVELARRSKLYVENSCWVAARSREYVGAIDGANQRHRERSERRGDRRRASDCDRHRHRPQTKRDVGFRRRLCAAQPADRPLPSGSGRPGVSNLCANRDRPAGGGQSGDQPDPEPRPGFRCRAGRSGGAASGDARHGSQPGHGQHARGGTAAERPAGHRSGRPFGSGYRFNHHQLRPQLSFGEHIRRRRHA